MNRSGENSPNWRGGISKNKYRYKLIQIARYPERVKARQMVHDYIKTGRLEKKQCEKCGAADAHAHHKDYSKPLDVVWLCRECHNKLHRGEI